MTNKEYVFALLRACGILLAWGLFLGFLMKQFEIELGGPYSYLRVVCFLFLLWVPTYPFTKAALRELKRRREVGLPH
jgi:hypothetical protein